MEGELMQPYPAYKDSGFDWLGEIPAHWELERIKHVAALINEKYDNHSDGFHLSLEDIEGHTGQILSSTQFEGSGNLFKKNDVLFSKLRPYLAKVVIAPQDGVGVGELLVLRAKAIIDHQFLHARMLSKPFIDIVESSTYGAKMPRANWGFIGNLQIPVPPLEEQKAIVVFLEEQTAVINQFLANKRQLITLLEEQKQVVINTAVTQGLDTAVARKPSGIDWLGDIPAHWEAIKLKHLSRFIQTGPFGSQLHAHDYVDNETPVINPIHLQNGRILPDWSITVDNETLTRLERHRLEIGDVILARRGELGRCAVVDSESAGWLCGTGSMNLRPKSDRVFSPYLAQIIQSEKVKNWLTTESVGSTMDNLNGSILGNLKVPVPPIQEQQKIIYSCREREFEINAAIERTQREIELIEEYRTTLIATAVTGKIDIR
jgi:type I restriction enzyme S subunit